MTIGSHLKETDIDHLTRIVGRERLSRGESVRFLHSHDESFHKPCLPEVVLWPRSTDEVSRIVAHAFQQRIPVTPWGAGSSLEGNPIPVSGGIVLDLQEMNRVLAVRPEDFQVDVEAGVVYKDLNRILEAEGLFFPPDPGAAATVGGMIGNNASGIRSVKYGATRDYVMRLTAVLSDGQVIQTGSRSRKCSSGYDLCRLLTGAEGTLGIVTEATLKLMGLPAAFMAVRATFPSVDHATRAVFEIMRSGVTPGAMEFLDTDIVGVLNRDRGLSLEESPTLLMEFNGYSERGLEDEMLFVSEICRDNGCLLLDRGIGPAERKRLWEIRHLTHESIRRAHPGLKSLSMDVAVPLSRYSQMVAHIKEIVADLTAYIFGHAGDGNIHVVVMDDPENEERWARVEAAHSRVVSSALSFEGTCTGEHGIGLGKKQFMAREHGESLETMKKIKALLDPRGILNPGKMFP
ncbi:D-lactate dehydrogenase (cytochrome) [Syntrophus gentianae]|uniref:D-lactate dehydrogenase (cytochrome) n=1 Tax=Syntrophus gentianae TaxID=43775 RepID=A0A1H7Y5M8_9BACT|nr:FAD-binding oxidoreductase [Syntrophus gentianae]SEM41440.1 D-lactate dehydrogenase (cytochrome) [Syntrophus gentianae]